MIHSEGSTGDGLADDIFEVSDYQAARPAVARPFLPWHLPRKQFVRDTQWMVLARALASSFPPEDGVFRYLGLPGDDLLDLRQLHDEVTQPAGIALRFVGFNTSAGKRGEAQVDLNISLDEVMKLPGIDPRSVILADKLELIGRPQSAAVSAARKAGTFDVINLDLCDGFCQTPPSAVSQTYYDAMGEIMGMQRRRTRPWLLLLTTRVDAATVNANVWPPLAGHYENNLRTSAPFQELSQTLLGVGAAADIPTALAEPTAHGKLVLTALCKWIASLAVQVQSKLIVKSVIGYRVVPQSAAPDLVSVGMWIEPVPTPAPDPSGLSRAQPVALNEAHMALRALQKICAQTDADQLLADDGILFAETKLKAADVLERARYDKDAYLAWLDVEHEKRSLAVTA